MLFGEKLQKMRKLNGMSQEQLAEKLNVSRQAVSKWEIGSLPDVDNIIKISKYFDCSLDYLMNNDIDQEDYRIVEEKTDVVIIDEMSKKKESKTRLLFVFLGISSLIILFILWVLAKILPAPIVRQDYASEIWYTGFLGFIDYHNLFFVVYLCVFLFLVSISIYLFSLFYETKKNNNMMIRKKSLIFAVCCYILSLIAVIIWLYDFLNPEVFIWNLFSIIFIFGYGLCVFLTAFLSRYYWEIKQIR